MARNTLRVITRKDYPVFPSPKAKKLRKHRSNKATNQDTKPTISDNVQSVSRVRKIKKKSVRKPDSEIITLPSSDKKVSPVPSREKRSHIPGMPISDVESSITPSDNESTKPIDINTSTATNQVTKPTISDSVQNVTRVRRIKKKSVRKPDSEIITLPAESNKLQQRTDMTVIDFESSITPSDNESTKPIDINPSTATNQLNYETIEGQAINSISNKLSSMRETVRQSNRADNQFQFDHLIHQVNGFEKDLDEETISSDEYNDRISFINRHLSKLESQIGNQLTDWRFY